MNRLEHEMVDLLSRMRDKYSVVGVKAEFEAEGTRTEELYRLKEISLAAGISLTLKIGGCEAVRDLYDARSIGVDHLVAPMVESAFALQKYLRAVSLAFPEDERKEIQFLVNIETIETMGVLDDIFRIPEINQLNGIVIGRGDLVESMGCERTQVDNDRSFELTGKAIAYAKQLGMVTVVGGGITVGSLDFLRRIPPGKLDRYETRKICFSCPGALGPEAPLGIELALEFELFWLTNKRNYYKAISEEDMKRLGTLQKRLNKNI